MLRNSRFQLGLLAAAVLVIVLREPGFFLNPRFWAEEATVYFRGALLHPWWEFLFMRQFGYLCFAANVSALIAANTVSLRNAPLVGTLFSFFVMLIPISLVIWSPSPWWTPRLKKVIFVLLFLVVPVTGEIWLTSLHSMNYLNVIPFLLLLEEQARSRWRARLNYSLLVFAGLATPVSGLFVPLFLLRYWRSRSREDLIQTLSLGACGALQLFFLLQHQSTGPAAIAVGSRFEMVSWTVVPSILALRTVIVPVLGPWLAGAFVQLMHSVGPDGTVVLSLSVVLTVSAFLWWLARKKPGSWPLYFAFLQVYIASLVALASYHQRLELIDSLYGARYFYLPTLIFLCLLLSGVRWNRGFYRGRSALCSLALTLTFVSG